MRTKFLIIALLLGAVVSSCRKEDPFGSGSGRELQQRTLSCVLDADTKLDIDGAGKTRWEPGDRILVHGEYTGSGKSATVTLEAGDISADGKTATIRFSGVKPYDRSSDKGYLSTIYAGYPADAVINNDHCYYYTQFNDTNHPLMAAYDSGDKLVFYNLCGVISFTVSGDFDSYEFYGNGGETVGYTRYRSYLVLKKDGTPRLDYNYTSDNGTSGPLTSVSGSLVADGSTVNRICIPAGANFKTGFTLLLKKNGQAVRKASTQKAVNLKRNSLLALGDIGPQLTELSPGGDEPSDPEAERLARLGKTPVICCYFTEYTSSSVFPTLEDVKYFTHINVGHARFANPKTGDGGLVIKSPGPSYIKKLVAFKSSYPELKLLLFIGGWGKNADGFSEMAKDDTKRALFCSECVRLCQEYNLDGVDLDWEYPTYAAKSTLDDGTTYYNGADPADKQNFTTLVKELRAALGKDKLITFAASSSDYKSAEYINYKEVLEWVDYINVMTYSMGDPNPQNPAKQKHNSPLYTSSRFYNSRGGADCMEGFHNKQGVPYDRMNYGVGFYGHGDGDVYPSSVSYAIAREALEKGTAKGKSVASYNIRWWDEESKSCYLGDANGVMYASYEDAESIAYRVAYAKQKGLLGVFAWEYREDDDTGTLRKALYDLMTQ